MARMYSGKKGKSGSHKPVEEKDHKWVNYKPKEIEQLILKIAKTGKTPSQIGMILRDEYGIPDLEKLTKKKLVMILKENKAAPELPEDLTALIKREIIILKHMEKNKHDQPSKRGLLLTESKIRRLVKYYKRVGKLPATWKYSKEQAKLLVS